MLTSSEKKMIKNLLDIRTFLEIYLNAAIAL